MTKNGTEYIEPSIEDKPNKKKTREGYVDKVLRDSLKKNPKISLYDLAEVGKLAKEQYDDGKTYKVKQEKVCVSLL